MPNTSLQRTRRQSLPSFLLAAELDNVRRQIVQTLRLVATLRHLSCLCLLLAPLGELRAVEPRIVVGAHATADYASTPYGFSDVPGADVFSRYMVSPALALEFSAGYRRYESSSGDKYFLTYGLTQYPLCLGASVFLSSSGIRPLISAGISVAPSEVAATTSSGVVQRKETSVVVGAYGTLGAQVQISPRWYVDAAVGCVWNPVQSNITNYASYYVRGQLGLAVSF